MTTLPPPPVPAWAPLPSTRPRVRWGFGDAVWSLAAAFVVANIVGAISIVVRHPVIAGETPHSDALDDVWAGLAQYVVLVGLIWLLIRAKGARGLADLGVGRPVWRDLRFVGLGIVAAIAINLAVAPPVSLWSRAGYGSQQVGEQLKHASGPVILALGLIVVVAAPISEELLFRGVVLRSGLRRWSPVVAVLVAGLSFGAFHLVDLDTLPSLAGLAAFGCLSGVVAVRTGRLAPSIAMHMGFNLLGAVALLASR